MATPKLSVNNTIEVIAEAKNCALMHTLERCVKPFKRMVSVLSVTVDENMMEIDNCQCGEQNKSGNFECNDCGKIFCDKCPNRPVETQCIECMLVDTNLVTSTPIKNH